MKNFVNRLTAVIFTLSVLSGAVFVPETGAEPLNEVGHTILFADGGFEQGDLSLANMTAGGSVMSITSDAEYVNSGSKALKLVNNGGANTSWNAYLTLKQGYTYVFAASVRGTTGGTFGAATFQMMVDGTWGGDKVSTTIPAGTLDDGWKTYRVRYTSTKNTSATRVNINFATGDTGDIYIDDVYIAEYAPGLVAADEVSLDAIRLELQKQSGDLFGEEKDTAYFVQSSSNGYFQSAPTLPSEAAYVVYETEIVPSENFAGLSMQTNGGVGISEMVTSANGLRTDRWNKFVWVHDINARTSYSYLNGFLVGTKTNSQYNRVNTSNTLCKDIRFVLSGSGSAYISETYLYTTTTNPLPASYNKKLILFGAQPVNTSKGTSALITQPVYGKQNIQKMYLYTNTASDAYFDVGYTYSTPDVQKYLVFEISIAPDDSLSYFAVGTNGHAPVSVQVNKAMLRINRWNKIVVVQDLVTNKSDTWVNGVKKDEGRTSSFNSSARTVLRPIIFGTANSTKTYVDDMLIYETTSYPAIQSAYDTDKELNAEYGTKVSEVLPGGNTVSEAWRSGFASKLALTDELIPEDIIVINAGDETYTYYDVDLFVPATEDNMYPYGTFEYTSVDPLKYVLPQTASVTRSDEYAHGGSYSLKVEGQIPHSSVIFEVPTELENGTEVVFSCYTLMDEDPITTATYLHEYVIDAGKTYSTNRETGWLYNEVNTRVANGKVKVQVKAPPQTSDTNEKHTFYIDDIVIQQYEAGVIIKPVSAELDGTLSAGNTVNVSADFANKTGDVRTTHLIVCVYDSTGRMRSAAGECVTIDRRGKYTGFEQEISIPSDIGNNAYVKIFALDSLDNITPLMSEVTLR